MSISRLYIDTLIFRLYAKYIMQNAGLDEAQARIEIARRNISNLRYAYDTTLMAESEEELKSLLIKVKEVSEKVYLFVKSIIKPLGSCSLRRYEAIAGRVLPAINLSDNVKSQKKRKGP